MNRLKLDKQIMVINGLVEGNSIRAISRMTGVHKNTIMSLLVSVGEQCQVIMDKTMKGLNCQTVQADEIWAYVGKKQAQLTWSERRDKAELGDYYIFVALDADSKLIPTYSVGKRTADTTNNFLRDLKRRVKGRIQLTTDSFSPYRYAVYYAFGSDIDYAWIQKNYKEDVKAERRYSPPKIASIFHEVIYGNPNPKKISTSYVERQNLTMRMQIRRFTRLTNAFSKKLENLQAAVALHFAHYNFCRIHQSLRVTPAMQAGVTNRLWNVQDLLTYTN